MGYSATISSYSGSPCLFDAPHQKTKSATSSVLSLPFTILHFQQLAPAALTTFAPLPYQWGTAPPSIPSSGSPCLFDAPHQKTKSTASSVFSLPLLSCVFSNCLDPIRLPPYQWGTAPPPIPSLDLRDTASSVLSLSFTILRFQQLL